MLRVQETPSIAAVDSASWNALVPPGYCSARWEYLYAAELRCGDALSSYRYYTFHEGEHLTGVALAYSARLSLAKMLPAHARPLVSWIGRGQEVTVVMCGTITSDALPGVFIAPGGARAEILEALDVRLRARMTELNAIGVIYKEFTPADAAITRELLAKGYVRAASLPSYSLELRWPDMVGYRGALNKKYRQAYAKTVKKLEQPEIRWEHVSDPAQVPAGAYTLYRAVHDRAQYQIETLTPEFFAEVLARDPRAELIALKCGDHLLGFVLSIEDEHALQGLYLGYDERQNERYDLYFNLVFKLLEVAMAKKKRCLVLGQTADAFKLRLGCSWVETCFLFRFHNPLVHAGMKRLAPIFFPTEAPPARNVFKTEGPKGPLISGGP